MSLKDYRADQAACPRCSVCKWTSFYHPKRSETLYVCPSISKYKFHAFSGSGKLNVGLSINEEHTSINESTADIAYKCTLCGACDYACKTFFKHIDVAENIEELRAACVDAGKTYPAHEEMVASIKENGNMLKKARKDRIDWAGNTKIKTLLNGEKGKVMYHAGCKYSFEPGLQKRLEGTVSILLKSGVDLVTAGMDETCCGGRALQLGFINQGVASAKALKAKVEKAGAKTIITSCAHCYSAFKYYYPRHGIDLGVEILHTSELLYKLMKQGDLKLNELDPVNITYHDPCNLGRRSEAYPGKYDGDKRARPISLTKTGEKGVYNEPRELLKAIPNVNLTEMDRIKGYAYCCGAGAGVQEVNPDLKEFAGDERIKEAAYTGAEVIVTACPWCEESLKSAASRKDGRFSVMDIEDLVIKSAGGEGK